MARNIIAAGPWHARDEFTNLHRIVLCTDGEDTFVVTSDILVEESCNTRRYFGSGTYFRGEQINDAIREFGRQCGDFLYTIDTGKDVRY